MANRTFHHIAADGTKIETKIDPSNFTLTTQPGTDIWRPSFTESRFDAPHILTSLPSSGSLKTLRVTMTADWHTKFDQGGLLLLWPSPSGKQAESKWLKTGIEFFNGKPALSVVGCDRLSDWSLAPLPASAGKKGEATVSVEKEGSTLWVYALLDDGKGGTEKMPLREIKWALQEGREAGAELWVGVCVAKPAEGSGEGELTVRFRDWVLETEE